MTDGGPPGFEVTFTLVSGQRIETVIEAELLKTMVQTLALPWRSTNCGAGGDGWLWSAVPVLRIGPIVPTPIFGEHCSDSTSERGRLCS